MSNTTFEQNEVKLLHEYGLSPKDRRHKEEVEAACPMHITMPEVYELLEKMYKIIVSMYDLRQTLEEFFGSISRFEKSSGQLGGAIVDELQQGLGIGLLRVGGGQGHQTVVHTLVRGSGSGGDEVHAVLEGMGCHEGQGVG